MWKPQSILTFNTDTKEWSKTRFETFLEYKRFVESMWKFPGKYNFKNTEYWIQPAIKFKKEKRYCDYHPNSKEFKNFWIEERRKCEQGVIIDGVWISPDLYFFWNYCPIYDKLENSVTLPKIWDGHYHYDLHCQIAFLNGLDVVMTKARQKGISLYHMARMTRKVWFGNKNTLKVVGHEELYVTDEWSIMEGYRNHLNEHTGWYRHFSPNEALNWEQRREVTQGVVNKKKLFKGNRTKIKGLTTKMNVTRAVGGCHAQGDKIYTTKGLKNVEDIKVGDFVFGIDGNPKQVLCLHTGVSKIYEVRQKYGDAYYVIGNHLLHLTTENKRYKEQNINITVEEYLEKSKDKWFNRSYSGIKSSKILNFPSKKIDIDPYLLGLWLGDGYSSCSKIIVNNSKDPEILEYLKNNPFNQSTNFFRKEKDRYNDEMYVFSYTQSKRGKRDNYIFNALKNYNLIKNKHIPDDYIYNDKNIRLQILAGLIDTNGTYTKKRNEYEISSKRQCFLEQIQILCSTLGMYSSIRKINSKEHFVKDKKIKASVSYILRIVVSENLVIPCKINRKKTISKKRRSVRTPIEIIDTNRVEPYYGFECEDHLYVLKDGTITHNSATEIYITEAGVNPKLKKIKEFVDPNMKMGNVKTGLFIAAGAVGELKDAEDLMEFCLNPKPHGIRWVEDVFSGSMEPIAFFFPEEWNYTHQDEDTGEVIICYDKNGNSDIELAISLILKEDQNQRKKDEASYKLWKSQHPRTLQDAFDQREDNPFPTSMIKEHKMKLITKKPIIIRLGPDAHNSAKIKHFFSDDVPVSKLSPNPNEDNRGALVVSEFPIDNPPFGLYYIGIDPIYNKDTSTSKSLMSMSVWIGTHERDGKIIEPYPVAYYTGRHKNVRDTYQVCLDTMEWYNARTAVESNVKDFIEWVIRQGKSRYLMRRRELTAITEMSPDSTIRDEIGVYMEGKFKERCLEKFIAWLETPISAEFDLKTGEHREIYNVAKLIDPMLLDELLRFTPKKNTDRLIANMLGLIAAQTDTNRHVITNLKNPLLPRKEPVKLQPSDVSVFKTKQTGHFKSMPSPFKKRF